MNEPNEKQIAVAPTPETICTCHLGSVGAVECKIHNPQPDWEYSPYRAALRYRGLIWALITNDGKNPIPEGDAEMLVDILNTHPALLRERDRLREALKEISEGSGA